MRVLGLKGGGVVPSTDGNTDDEEAAAVMVPDHATYERIQQFTVHRRGERGVAIAPAPAADDFAVPDDDDCPLASAPPAYAAGGARPPALRGALPFARAA